MENCWVLFLRKNAGNIKKGVYVGRTILLLSQKDHFLNHIYPSPPPPIFLIYKSTPCHVNSWGYGDVQSYFLSLRGVGAGGPIPLDFSAIPPPLFIFCLLPTPLSRRSPLPCHYSWVQGIFWNIGFFIPISVLLYYRVSHETWQLLNILKCLFP